MGCSRDAAARRTARPARVLIGLVALAGAAALPGHLNELRRDWPLLRLWSDPDAQQRLAIGPAYDFLRAADAVLPREASVMLTTSGADVRHAEYTSFHRALYFLTPRPVWWMTPAPSDGTWESRWWISAPLTAESISAVAREKHVSHLLAFGPSVRVGERIADLPGGTVFALAPERHANSGAADPPATRVALYWPIRLGAAVLVIAVLGLSAVAVAARQGLQAKGIERAALAWTFGAGLTSIAMLWLDAMGVTLGGQVAIVSLMAAASLAALRRSERNHRPAVEPPRAIEHTTGGRRLLAASLLVLIAASILAAAVSALGKPLAAWDGWVLWGMRARAMFVEGHVSPTIYADPSRAPTLLGYPLLFPLLESWIYAWLGAPDDRLAGIVAVLCHAALPAVAYGALVRRGADRVLALSVSAALAAVPSLVHLAGDAFADVAVALFATVAAIHLVEWLEERRPGALIAAALAAGCLPWTKREGWVLAAALAVTTVGVGRACRSARAGALAIAAGAAVVAGPWYVFAALHALPDPQFDAVTAARFAAQLVRLPSIAWRTSAALMSPDASFVWPLAAVFAFACRRGAAMARPSAILPLTASLYLAALAFSYVFSAYAPYQQHIASSFFRLAAHVVALPLLWIGYHAAAKP